MGLFDMLKDHLNDQAQIPQRRVNEAMRRFALTCRGCSALAAPILGTSNRYRCVGCGKQFTAAHNDLGRVISNQCHGWGAPKAQDLYDAAVRALKT